MNCAEVRDNLSLYLYGELESNNEDRLEQHLAGCPDCALALDSERQLHAALDRAAATPPPALLAACRRDLSAAIHASRPTVWDRMRAFLAIPALKPVAALAMLAVGFLGGRMAPSQPSAPVATRVRSLEPDGTGRVNLVVDETRQRTINGSLADDAIRRLVMAAAQDEADPGLRVESVDVLRRESSASEVRRALMAALVADANPGVRQKALDGLRPHSADPDVQRALAQMLMRDDNSGLRAQAIDLLVQHRRRDMVGVLQELALREQDEYVRSRTRLVLTEMRASADPF
jgi:anti-sigma factor (TIGR02949 family)